MSDPSPDHSPSSSDNDRALAVDGVGLGCVPAPLPIPDEVGGDHDGDEAGERHRQPDDDPERRPAG